MAKKKKDNTYATQEGKAYTIIKENGSYSVWFIAFLEPQFVGHASSMDEAKTMADLDAKNR